VISYAIIEKGAQSLTGAGNAKYSLSYDVRANGVFVPLAFDALANSLARTKQIANRSPLPSLTAGIQYDPSIKVKSHRFTDMVKEILRSDGARQIGGFVAKAAMSMLLASEPQAEPL